MGAAYPSFGDRHGYAVSVPARAGINVVCVYGINVGAGSNRLVGCRDVSVGGSNGLEGATLRRAGIEKADGFAAVMPGDNRNLMAAQLARDIFKVPRVITRIYDPIRAEVFREMGLETICSTVIGASLIHDYFVDGVNRADAVAGAGGRKT